MGAQRDLQTAKAKLERLRIRLTPLRSAVLEAIYQEPGRPAVDKLYRRLAPRFPKLQPTSVRSAIHVFDKLGVLPVEAGDAESGGTNCKKMC